jgi:mono/diheme cytochrome c family protein
MDSETDRQRKTYFAPGAASFTFIKRRGAHSGYVAARRYASACAARPCPPFDASQAAWSAVWEACINASTATEIRMTRVHHILLWACTLSVPAAAIAQPPRDLGKREFESSCAVCHGATARGDGPLRPFLVKPPPDLTALAQRNGGKFPTERVMAMIDGRDAAVIGSHGPRDMPVWGQVYFEDALANADRAKMNPEWSVRARIIALIDYLGRLQVK